MKTELTTESFGELIFKEKAILYGLAMQKTKNPIDAEELVSETFAKALERKGQYKDRGYLKHWLARIMHNIFIDDFRKKKNFNVIYFENAFMFQKQRTINLGYSNLRTEEMMKEVNKLPKELKEPLLLRKDGHDYKEIAEIIGIPRGTMGPRLMRARQLLRKTIEV